MASDTAWDRVGAVPSTPRGLPPRPRGQVGKVYDTVNTVSTSKGWPVGIRLAYLATLSHLEGDDLPGALRAAETWERPVGDIPPPAGAEKITATVRAMLYEETAAASGSYKGPAQFILPGAGDIKTPAGKARGYAILAGLAASAGAAAYVYVRWIR